MIAITAGELAAATGGKLSHAAANLVVSGPVVVDSRLVEPGSLFVAVSGQNVDGADFAGTALAAGAVLVLANRPLATNSGEPIPTLVVADVPAALGHVAAAVLAKVRFANPHLQVIAITGSYGKTTTKDLLAQLLVPAADGFGGQTISPKGSFNNEIGLPLTVATISSDTQYAVLEMGADAPGNITYLTSIAPPNIGIVLAVGAAHLETFGTVDNIALGKSEMVTGTLPDGAVVLNADDPRVAAMAAKAAPTQTVVFFGQAPSAQVRAVNVALDAQDRASFDLVVSPDLWGAPSAERRSWPIKLQISGIHHVTNALAAASAALLLGASPAVVAHRLSLAAALSPHRMAVTQRGDQITIIDDSYNANPESMKAGLQALKRIATTSDNDVADSRAAGPPRTIAVLGAMRELGDAAVAAHDEIGRIAVRLGVDRLLVVGEDAHAIQLGAIQEGASEAEAVFVPDLPGARQVLADLLQPGDVVLIKASNGSGLWQLADELTTETLPLSSGAAPCAASGEADQRQSDSPARAEKRSERGQVTVGPEAGSGCGLGEVAQKGSDAGTTPGGSDVNATPCGSDVDASLGGLRFRDGEGAP